MTDHPQKTENPAARNKPGAPSRRIFVPLLIALGAVSSPNLVIADNSARPFKSNFEAVPTGPDTVAGQGNATHLGKIDIEFSRSFASTPGPSNPCVSFQFIIVTITAANGDELWMDYTGGDLCFDFTAFPVITFSGAVDLVGTGGTGRFDDSTGDYQLRWDGEITALGVTNIGVIEGVIGY